VKTGDKYCHGNKQGGAWRIWGKVIKIHGCMQFMFIVNCLLILFQLQKLELSYTLCQVTYQEMVEDEAKDIQNVEGPIHKLIQENTKSNSMVIKVTSKLSVYLFLVWCYIFHWKLSSGLNWYQNRNHMWWFLLIS